MNVCKCPCLCMHTHRCTEVQQGREVAVMNGCGGCYCGNSSECANSCNVTNGRVSYSRITLCHHHYHTGKPTVLSSPHLKSTRICVLYVSAPLSTVLQGVWTFKGIVAVAPVIYSEQENENKVLPWFGCFDRWWQIEKRPVLQGW